MKTFDFFHIHGESIHWVSPPFTETQPLQSLAGYLGEHVIPRHNWGEKHHVEVEIAFISELFTKAGGTASKASIALPFEGSGEPWKLFLPKFYPFPVRIWLFTWEIEMGIVYEFAKKTWMMARKLKNVTQIENG